MSDHKYHGESDKKYTQLQDKQVNTALQKYIAFRKKQGKVVTRNQQREVKAKSYASLDRRKAAGQER